ncbi:ZIP family zinc transporter [Salegentibacter sp. 24]|uniref:ZIP family metal transporter n=1 Tax=Salegentibacter sp. 24 TaxID=2183986 RepID=UPI00105C24AE|nr:ZIP family metal transporter [Salegentibacter sp. 24]TDN88185.1 ZIP family zinc transporter [Salegentibacter sp. 24]
MPEVLQIIIFSAFSGMTVFIGGILAYYYAKISKRNKQKKELNHFVIALGGGIILAALALVLIPKGMEKLSLLPLILCFSAGTLIFFYLDKKIEKSGSKLSQLIAMLLDFIPEALALGAIFATDKQTGLLLAIFIGLQNLPESFNSYQDLIANGYRTKKALTILFLLSFMGIIGATTGYYLLRDLPKITAGIMTFASGGILYLIFQDIAPDVRLKKHWLPALGANLGFLIGIIGDKLIH